MPDRPASRSFCARTNAPSRPAHATSRMVSMHLARAPLPSGDVRTRSRDAPAQPCRSACFPARRETQRVAFFLFTSPLSPLERKGAPSPLSPPASRALGTWAGKQRGGGCAWRGGGGDDGVSEPPETPPAGASSRARAARAHWRGRPVSKVPGSERMRTWPRGDVTILAHNNSASVARTRSARLNNNNGAGMRVGRRSSLGAEVVISPIDRVPRPRPARRPTAPRPPS